MQLGYEESGKGPLLLLIHGFPLDRTVWNAQLSGLSDVRRVVAVDLRGRGKSPSSDGWSIDDLADDVAETIDAFGEEKADIAGISMGGYVAFALLRRHPEKVRSLILIDTKAGSDNAEAKAARDKTAETVRSEGTGALVEDLGAKLVSPDPSEEVRAEVRRIFEGIPGESSAADAVAMRDRPDSTGDLAELKIPVLVIHGEQDQLMPLDVGKELASQIPGAKFVSIAGAGHLSPLESPEAVNEAVRQFL